MKIENLPFSALHVIRTLFFLHVPKNAKKQEKSSFTTCRVLCVGGASWSTLLTKGSHGDASLCLKKR